MDVQSINRNVKMELPAIRSLYEITVMRQVSWIIFLLIIVEQGDTCEKTANPC